jgi:hypothetical protein
MQQTQGFMGSLYGEASESDRGKTDEMPLIPRYLLRKHKVPALYAYI